jgi:hypothetical protein
MPGTTPEAEPVIRPFADVLLEMQSGLVHGDLTTRLHELTTAVREHGKGGAISLTIKVEPVTKGDGGTVTVSGAIAAKIPRSEPKKSIFFLAEDGNLSRDDPRQLHLPLREVAAPAATPLREAVGMHPAHPIREVPGR